MKSAGKQRIVWVAVFLGALFVAPFAAIAAAPETETPKSPATTMALIDVAYIFKNHKGFNAEMKTFEQRAQNLQQSAQATEAALKQLKTQMEQTEDKVEKEKLEAELARQATEFQLSARKAQQQMGESEAKIYYDTYMLLQQEVTKHCRAHGIHVVLKFQREAIKANDRRSVMEGLARPIVFSDAPDISDDILKVLNAAAEVKTAQGKTGEQKR